MRQKLTLTDCDSVPTDDILSAREASARIANLIEDGIELPDSIAPLGRLIRSISCAGYRINERLDLLQRLRHPLEDLLQLLYEKQIGISLPLSESDIQLLGSIDRLLRDFVRAYNSIINEPAAKSGLLRRTSKTDLARAYHGSISYQTRRLLLSYAAYRPVSTGIWSQIHLVYRLACLEMLENVPLTVERGERKFKTSIEHIYKRAILIGRSEPYHFSFRGIIRLFESLDEWPGRVELSRTIDKPKNDSLFIIDLESDYPAAPYFSSITFNPQGDRFLVLDTSELMASLTHELQVVTGAIRTGLKGIAYIQAFERMEILRHIVVSWGMHPIRKNERYETNVDCQVVFGMANIFSVLHPDLSRLEGRDIDLESTPEAQMMLGVFQERFGKQRNLDKLISTWKIGNESSGGYSLFRQDSSSQQLRVGELLALRKTPQDDWTVCLVRWAMVDDDGEVQAGLFRIGNDIEPVSVKPVDTGGGEQGQEYTAALRIPETGAFSNSELLVTQKTLFAPERALWVKRPDRDYLVRATRLLVSSRSVDVFTYRRDVRTRR